MYIYFLNFNKNFKILEILEEYSFPTFQWSERDSWVAQPYRWKCQRAYHSDGCLHKQLLHHKPELTIFKSEKPTT